ncbi:Uracil phosphoribosyltransferase [Mycena indigotica]|uniref:uracil phosphoribosyltransferase n=1 Tax=Mycena indigotica TaxID=2126181 RepID=A0A8H6SKP5_9AGAR|nr:Uracil phosphoribosyltransferase [Mycena indigotica]KAF7301393.1 Uracil phosphoribosyltransferase [Mycena indigotica]
MSHANIHVVSHPIANAELSKLRRADITPAQFRQGVSALSLILGLEASRELEVATFEGQSPVAPFTGTAIKPRVGLTPILRAGLGMTDALLSLFPDAPIYHLGIFREKVTLQPVEYYSKLPSSPPVDLVYLLDPLIATGGTACAALAMIADWGMDISNVKLLCILASQDGINNVRAAYPSLEIWVAGIDSNLTSEGLINPGLGDAGDRLFNTFA